MLQLQLQRKNIRPYIVCLVAMFLMAQVIPPGGGTSGGGAGGVCEGVTAVRDQSTQTFLSATVTEIDFDREIDPSAQTSLSVDLALNRVIALIAGVYTVTAGYGFGPVNHAQKLDSRITKNGVTLVAIHTDYSGLNGDTINSVVGRPRVSLAVNDYLTFSIRHTAGVGPSLTSITHRPFMSVSKCE